MLCRHDLPERNLILKNNKRWGFLQSRVQPVDRILTAQSTTVKILSGLLGAICVIAGFGLSRISRGEETKPILQPSLRTSAIAKLVTSAGSGDNLGHAFPLAKELIFEGAPQGLSGLTAFEENAVFVYAAAVIPNSMIAGESGTHRLLRRIIFLRPSALVVDDEVVGVGPAEAAEWRAYSRQAAQITGRKIAFTEGGVKLWCETLTPRRFAIRLLPNPVAFGSSEELGVEISSQQEPKGSARFLNVFTVGEPGRGEPEITSRVNSKGDELILKLVAQGKLFEVSLPSLEHNSGSISVMTLGGKPLLEARLFPSGILPHDAEGIRLLTEWDEDYRRTKPPPWDIGKAANELKEVVENGTVKKCRAVDLCCGTGTDAIFLASKGFDVTAVDISPAALVQAQQKAQQAGVSVRWVLADVLAPPSMQSFDFLYDRGCYHVVRNQNREAYLASVDRLSHPASKFLLLAARRDSESVPGIGEGVTEQELLFDFQSLFDVVWLRQNRLEANRPGGLGPPGWGALFQRKPGVGQ